jgi:hypothetical protein
MNEILINNSSDLDNISVNVIKELDIISNNVSDLITKVERISDDKAFITKTKTTNTSDVKEMNSTIKDFKSKVDELVFGEINARIAEINADSTKLTSLCKNKVEEIDNSRKDKYKNEAIDIIKNNCNLFEIDYNDKVIELIMHKTGINFNILSNKAKDIEEGIPKVFLDIKEDLDMFSIDFEEYLSYDLNSKKYAAHLSDLSKETSNNQPKEVDKVEARAVLNVKPEGKRDTVLETLSKDLTKTYSKISKLDINKQVVIDISLEIIKDVL